jgi:hypothetical protein
MLRPDLATVTARARDREVNPIAAYPPNIYEGLSKLGSLEGHVLDTTHIGVDEVLAAVTEGLSAGRFRLS